MHRHLRLKGWGCTVVNLNPSPSPSWIYPYNGIQEEMFSWTIFFSDFFRHCILKANYTIGGPIKPRVK